MKRNNVENFIVELKQRADFKGRHYPGTEEEQNKDAQELLTFAEGTTERQEINLVNKIAKILKTYNAQTLGNYIYKNYANLYPDLFEQPLHPLPQQSAPVVEKSNNTTPAAPVVEKSNSTIPAAPVVEKSNSTIPATTSTTPIDSHSHSSVPFNTKTSDSITKIIDPNNFSIINSSSSSSSSISINNQRTTTDLINTMINTSDSNSKPSQDAVPAPEEKPVVDKTSEEKVSATPTLDNLMNPRKDNQPDNDKKEVAKPQKEIKKEETKVMTTQKPTTVVKPQAEKEACYRIFDNHNHAKTLTESKIIELAQKYDADITTIHGAMAELEKHGLMVW